VSRRQHDLAANKEKARPVETTAGQAKFKPQGQTLEKGDN
tara:strand:+ start:399 stop:518 length:120 start_codon:yes stop_codon:yes gene_type:complete